MLVVEDRELKNIVELGKMRMRIKYGNNIWQNDDNNVKRI